MSVVDCPGKICTLEYIDVPSCLHYLPTPNSTCNIPCSLTGCRHEITHGLCPFWICKDMPVVPTLAPPPLPPPTPIPPPTPMPHFEESLAFYAMCAVAILFAIISLVLLFFLCLKTKRLRELMIYTIELRRRTGVDDDDIFDDDERRPILLSSSSRRQNTRAGFFSSQRNRRNEHQREQGERQGGTNMGNQGGASNMGNQASQQVHVQPEEAFEVLNTRTVDPSEIPRASDDCFSLDETSASVFPKCRPKNANIKQSGTVNPLLEEEPIENKVHKVQKYFETKATQGQKQK